MDPSPDEQAAAGEAYSEVVDQTTGIPSRTVRRGRWKLWAHQPQAGAEYGRAELVASLTGSLAPPEEVHHRVALLLGAVSASYVNLQLPQSR